VAEHFSNQRTVHATSAF